MDLERCIIDKANALTQEKMVKFLHKRGASIEEIAKDEDIYLSEAKIKELVEKLKEEHF